MNNRSFTITDEEIYDNFIKKNFLDENLLLKSITDFCIDLENKIKTKINEIQNNKFIILFNGRMEECLDEKGIIVDMIPQYHCLSKEFIQNFLKKYDYDDQNDTTLYPITHNSWIDYDTMKIIQKNYDKGILFFVQKNKSTWKYIGMINSEKKDLLNKLYELISSISSSLTSSLTSPLTSSITSSITSQDHSL